MTDRYDEVKALARAGLTGMIRRKDPAGLSGLRSIISTLENACAVPVADSSGEYARVGSTEAERRMLSDDGPLPSHPDHPSEGRGPSHRPFLTLLATMYVHSYDLVSPNSRFSGLET